jgi:hypothetical protein
MPKIYLRKKVRHPRKAWKYVYSGKSFKSIDQVKQDPNFVKFVNNWGNGVYECFCPKIGKIVHRFRISNFSYRATANKSGLPIKPSKFGKSKHQRKPECSSCYHNGYLKGYKKGMKLGKIEGYQEGWYGGNQKAKAEIVSSLRIPNILPAQPMPMYHNRLPPAKALPAKNIKKRRK